MPNLTLAIPEEMRRKMAMFPEINWSEVARRAIIEKTELLERMQALVSRSELTEREAIRLGERAKRNVWKRRSKH